MPSQPFSALIKSLRRSGMSYTDMQRLSNGVRSNAWFAQAAAGQDVKPPMGHDLFEIASMAGISLAWAKRLVVEQWFGVELSPARDRSVSLLRKLETLSHQDIELVEQLIQRLADSYGVRDADQEVGDDDLRDALEFGIAGFR